jgi:peptidyl-prolyl cis-trans isomerase-like 1
LALLPRNHQSIDADSTAMSTPGKDTGAVVMETSMGRIVFELYWKHAPKTCANFYQLAKQGFYDGIIFHRVISDFMIQTGDPTGTGSGGASIYGGAFEDELHPELRFVGAGILAMANAGANTNRSQFFVTLAPTPFLDGKHTIFGRVAEGLQAVREIGVAETKDDRYVDELFHLLLSDTVISDLVLFAELSVPLKCRPVEEIKIVRATVTYAD